MWRSISTLRKRPFLWTVPIATCPLHFHEVCEEEKYVSLKHDFFVSVKSLMRFLTSYRVTSILSHVPSSSSTFRSSIRSRISSDAHSSSVTLFFLHLQLSFFAFVLISTLSLCVKLLVYISKFRSYVISSVAHAVVFWSHLSVSDVPFFRCRADTADLSVSRDVPWTLLQQ